MLRFPLEVTQMDKLTNMNFRGKALHYFGGQRPE